MKLANNMYIDSNMTCPKNEHDVRSGREIIEDSIIITETRNEDEVGVNVILILRRHFNLENLVLREPNRTTLFVSYYGSAEGNIFVISITYYAKGAFIKEIDADNIPGTKYKQKQQWIV